MITQALKATLLSWEKLNSKHLEFFPKNGCLRKKIALQNFWTNLQTETVRSCKLGSTQSEAGSSTATSTQLEVVNVVQHVIFKQNMALSAVTQVQPEFARGMQRKQRSLKAPSEHAGIRRWKGQKSGCYTDTESLSPGFPEANPRNVLESQENPQNLLRQQEAKIRAWFTLFLVKQNCWFRFSPITRILVLISLITI